jgi:uncharacterized protein (UPF0332 family)
MNKEGIEDLLFKAKQSIEAFDYRNEGDYGASNSIDTDIAEKLISNSKELLTAVTEYMKGVNDE